MQINECLSKCIMEMVKESTFEMVIHILEAKVSKIINVFIVLEGNHQPKVRLRAEMRNGIFRHDSLLLILLPSDFDLSVKVSI